MKKRRMKKAKILVIGGNAIITWDIATALKNFGYNTTVAHSGEEAIEKAKEINLVLMDITLIESINVKNIKKAIKPAEEIHKRFNIPVIYISTDPKPLREIKPESHILEKPFEEKDLLDIVGKALQK